MTLKNSLKNRPVLYEIVPPRRDTSRFNTELRGVQSVMEDRRIDAINIPELMTRRKVKAGVHYSPTTIPPEEYALMIKEYKEPVVNFIVPRLTRDEFVSRARKAVEGYGIRNLVLVGKERQEDKLPGVSVVDAFGLLKGWKPDGLAVGGICIFDRESSATRDYGSGSRLTEAKRIWTKARAGCDFVTSQITYDPVPALDFLAAYRRLCEENDTDPITVFVSLTTIPSANILSLIEGLDVALPPKVKKRIVNSHNMGKESLKAAAEIFEEIISESERRGDGIPLGLQVEQVGVNSGELSMELLDRVFPTLRRN